MTARDDALSGTSLTTGSSSLALEADKPSGYQMDGDAVARDQNGIEIIGRLIEGQKAARRRPFPSIDRFCNQAIWNTAFLRR
jgi:hypothetical protein